MKGKALLGIVLVGLLTGLLTTAPVTAGGGATKVEASPDGKWIAVRSGTEIRVMSAYPRTAKSCLQYIGEGEDFIWVSYHSGQETYLIYWDREFSNVQEYDPTFDVSWEQPVEWCNEWSATDGDDIPTAVVATDELNSASNLISVSKSGNWIAYKDWAPARENMWGLWVKSSDGQRTGFAGYWPEGLDWGVDERGNEVLFIYYFPAFGTEATVKIYKYDPRWEKSNPFVP